jgi:hypothetical protein
MVFESFEFMLFGKKKSLPGGLEILAGFWLEYLKNKYLKSEVNL